MDVANLNSVNDVINYFNPDTIIHAAEICRFLKNFH